MIASSPLALMDEFPFLKLIPSALFPLVFVILIAVVALVMWLIWRLRSSRTRKVKGSDKTSGTSEGFTVEPRALLTKEEATFLNLVQLASQDNFLVVPKLPLSSLVNISGQEVETRKNILRAVQPIRLDVVLVHPGTLRPSKVIKLVEDPQDVAAPEGRERLVEEILQAAGIELIRVGSSINYSVRDLVRILGLEEEE